MALLVCIIIVGSLIFSYTYVLYFDHFQPPLLSSLLPLLLLPTLPLPGQPPATSMALLTIFVCLLFLSKSHYVSQAAAEFTL